MGENQRLKSICFRVQFGGREGLVLFIKEMVKMEPRLRELCLLTRGRQALDNATWDKLF